MIVLLVVWLGLVKVTKIAADAVTEFKILKFYMNNWLTNSYSLHFSIVSKKNQSISIYLPIILSQCKNVLATEALTIK